MQQDNFNQPTAQQQSGLGIAGMVIGIIAILLSCIIIGGLFGVLGLILSIVALTQKGRKKGVAIAGLVLNIVAIIIMFIMIATSVSITPTDSKSTESSSNKIQTKESEEIEEPKNDGYATLDKFNQIETGMTYEEVVEIMGSEGTVMSESEVLDIKTTIYYWYAKNKVSNMNIMVQNNEVISKAQIGLD